MNVLDKVELVMTIEGKGELEGWGYRQWSLTVYNKLDGTRVELRNRGGLGWKPISAEEMLKGIVEDTQIVTMRSLVEQNGFSWERAEGIYNRVQHNATELNKVFTEGELNKIIESY